MDCKRIQLVVTGVAAWISLLIMITTTYGGSIVIGGDYTELGTIVVISPKPGDTPQANGTALLNNLANTPSDPNQPYLIKLGPGIYDIGTSSLQMKAYVDIEGSGEKTTKITSAVSSSTNGTINGASDAELRFLTVENTGGGASAIALVNLTASSSILHVTVNALGEADNNYGVYNTGSSSSPVLTNVTAKASGGANNYGVYNSSSSPVMANVTASASGGTNNYGVYNFSSSPVLTNVTAKASGGTNNYGVRNHASSPVLTNMTLSASEGTNNHGVYNTGSSSSPVLTNVTVSASGGDKSYGVYNSFSSPVLTNVTAKASGGTDNYGIYTFAGTLKINHSVIRGTTTILCESATTTSVGNTQLDGGAVINDTGGTLTCVGAYNGNYVALGTDCK
jgi:hypothetical protein